jgi:hypothetical protein
MWIALLPSKDRAVATIKYIQAAAEKKSGNTLGALRTDRGGEFTIAHFTEYCVDLGVRRELTTPLTPAKWCCGKKESNSDGSCKVYDEGQMSSRNILGRSSKLCCLSTQQGSIQVSRGQDPI